MVKKLLTLAFAAAFSVVAFAQTSITKAVYDKFAATKESANNKTVAVQDGINFVADNKAGWYLDVYKSGLEGTIDLAYKTSDKYFVVTFDINGIAKHMVGPGSGKDSVNHVKIGSFVEAEDDGNVDLLEGPGGFKFYFTGFAFAYDLPSERNELYSYSEANKVWDGEKAVGRDYHIFDINNELGLPKDFEEITIADLWNKLNRLHRRYLGMKDFTDGTVIRIQFGTCYQELTKEVADRGDLLSDWTEYRDTIYVVAIIEETGKFESIDWTKPEIRYARYLAYVETWNDFYLDPEYVAYKSILSKEGGLDHYHALLAEYGATSLPPYFHFDYDAITGEAFEAWADELEVGLEIVYAIKYGDEELGKVFLLDYVLNHISNLKN